MLKKFMTLGLVTVLLAVTAGCGTLKEKVDEGITISVGSWPYHNESLKSETYQNYAKIMKEKYNINIVPDDYHYSVQDYIGKAEIGQIPTVYVTWFTEIEKIVDLGYGADISNQIEENGFGFALNPIFNNILQVEGKYYAVPINAYAMGLEVNKNLLNQAGYVNADGTIKAPDTYEDFAKMGAEIKRITGKPGFALGTTGNIGGWNFMNIAWSYGVDFMEQNDEGRWEAVFNTPECVEAMQYVHDLKWKYDVLPEEDSLDNHDLKRMFQNGEVAMIFNEPSTQDQYVSTAELENEDLAFISVPRGPKGRYSLMGGNVYMVSNTATEEEKDAVFKWLDLIGISPRAGEEQIAGWEEEAGRLSENNGIVLGEETLKIWVDPMRQEKIMAIQKPYINVERKNFEDYLSFDGVIIQPEEPVECQNLYTVLDGVIREVLADKNADIPKLIAEAEKKFQENYLDKVQ